MDPTVQRAEATEQAAISEGREILSRVSKDKFRLGELAILLRKHGQTDEQIARGWHCHQSTVNRTRRVAERFMHACIKLTWSWRAYCEMLTWDDLDDCLEYAAECDVQHFHELEAWRNTRRQFTVGKPEPVQAPTVQAPEPFEPIAVPKQEEQQKHRETPEPKPSKAIATKQEPEHIDLRKAAGDAIRALRQLASDSDLRTRQATGKQLRKLADELDPPPSARFDAPTLEDVTAYCAEKGYTFEPEAAWAFYEANGWKQANGNKLKSWKAAMLTCQQRENKENGQSGNNSGLNSSLEALARAGNL